MFVNVFSLPLYLSVSVCQSLRLALSHCLWLSGFLSLACALSRVRALSLYSLLLSCSLTRSRPRSPTLSLFPSLCLSLFLALSPTRTAQSHLTPKQRWLKLQTIKYVDQTGKQRLWDVCTRTTRAASASASGVDAVVILARLSSRAAPQQVCELTWDCARGHINTHTHTNTKTRTHTHK